MIKRNLVMIYKIEGAVSYSCYMCFIFANKKKKHKTVGQWSFKPSLDALTSQDFINNISWHLVVDLILIEVNV